MRGPIRRDRLSPPPVSPLPCTPAQTLTGCQARSPAAGSPPTAPHACPNGSRSGSWSYTWSYRDCSSRPCPLFGCEDGAGPSAGPILSVHRPAGAGRSARARTKLRASSCCLRTSRRARSARDSGSWGRRARACRSRAAARRASCGARNESGSGNGWTRPRSNGR
eukprot:scaffold19930_cov115-Isochrysis_galbana.AAC.2